MLIDDAELLPKILRLHDLVQGTLPTELLERPECTGTRPSLKIRQQRGVDWRARHPLPQGSPRAARNCARTVAGSGRKSAEMIAGTRGRSRQTTSYNKSFTPSIAENSAARVARLIVYPSSPPSRAPSGS